MSSEMKIVSGSAAATHVAYALSDVVTIYPISPASDMGDLADQWAAQGRKNLMNQTVTIHEMQSEAGVAGTVHGCLTGGALTTTFTASQGLLLMIPNMYKIAGELLPAVFHVTARSLSAHALSIFGDHQDIMACRQTGFAMLASSSVQECMDLGLVAHLSAIDGSVPFCHFYDGWRTSNEMQKIHPINYEDMADLVNWDRVKQFRDKAMNPEHPDVRGTAQNPDVYFQNREAANKYYMALPDIVDQNMRKVEKLTGRSYHLFDYTGHPEAEYVIVAMCSACDVIEEVVRCKVAAGEKVGLIKVRLYRPFSAIHLIEALPSTAKVVCALDRTKEPGSQGEPLFQDVCTALYQAKKILTVSGGRYGLSSKEFTPSMVKTIFDHLQTEQPEAIFTIGITDDVTHLSLPVTEHIETTPPDISQCKFYGFGSDGTIGANKEAAKIIGDNTDLYTQAYFAYDSKKSGGYTVSHLRFGKQPIQSAYEITSANYIACHKDNYVQKFDLLENIQEKAVFVLNSSWTLQEMEQQLPAKMRRTIAEKQLKFYNIDAFKIAAQAGLGERINMIMEAVFFKLSGVMDVDKALGLLKENVKILYANKGDDVVQQNIKAIDDTLQALEEISYPLTWKNATDPETETPEVPEFIAKIARTILALEGDRIPVSMFSADGCVPVGTTAYEKRNVAINIPQWDPDKCIECCHCSLVCPHAAIRPVLATENELKGAPASFVTKKAMGGAIMQGLSFRIQVYPEDCLGCGSCANVCPGVALSMKPLKEERITQMSNLTYAEQHISIKDNLLPRNTVKGSQFQQPLLEFSGACAGCGETPYVKLITQLFGERMIIANATGCSSIWGASMPSMPYTVTKDGRGPAWGNSLFEDAAEYGYGIASAITLRRNKLTDLVSQALARTDLPDTLHKALDDWNKNADDAGQSFVYGKKLLSVLADQPADPLLDAIKERADLFGKKSVWVVGGDGWAYDIGFGGLDHVLSTGENINMLVLDTECYSNTGGQTSKATPIGAIAKFASLGKSTNKKDLGRMLMTYENVYVASVAMGANMQQTINALTEAEAYNGPSIVIAYCPCINHGIKKGMATAIYEETQAVQCGYWPLYRFNPELSKAGKDPLTIDYKKPDGTMDTFLDGENRYAYLPQIAPQRAQMLRTELKENCEQEYQSLTDSEDSKNISS